VIVFLNVRPEITLITKNSSRCRGLSPRWARWGRSSPRTHANLVRGTLGGGVRHLARNVQMVTSSSLARTSVRTSKTNAINLIGRPAANAFTRSNPAWSNVGKKNATGNCVDLNTRWCPAHQRLLTDCEALTWPCYYKIMCHSPCICPSWKEVRCGGKVSGSPDQCTTEMRQELIQLAETRDSSSSATLLSRSGKVHVSGSVAMDSSLRSKCT